MCAVQAEQTSGSPRPSPATVPRPAGRRSRRRAGWPRFADRLPSGGRASERPGTPGSATTAPFIPQVARGASPAVGRREQPADLLGGTRHRADLVPQPVDERMLQRRAHRQQIHVPLAVVVDALEPAVVRSRCTAQAGRRRTTCWCRAAGFRARVGTVLRIAVKASDIGPRGSGIGGRAEAPWNDGPPALPQSPDGSDLHIRGVPGRRAAGRLARTRWAVVAVHAAEQRAHPALLPNHARSSMTKIVSLSASPYSTPSAATSPRALVLDGEHHLIGTPQPAGLRRLAVPADQRPQRSGVGARPLVASRRRLPRELTAWRAGRRPTSALRAGQ